ncbi:Store-operated calcium entry regulator STIMATE [Portunus trituberculatus]|uniref:Store-operated calcium entry regulator STIMATE n=1 Tax=Portunus trituberculatus TaxID=210409 RepID=A0A5B7D3Q4_PORTR|nr:Store-operated calcium entry regulator STIMATE [Portunus trituberculatus]
MSQNSPPVPLINSTVDASVCGKDALTDSYGWYIISFLLDSTLGLAIIWAGIRLSIYIGQKNGWPTIIFGEYGRPPSVRAWGHQCALYVGIMVVEKIIITGLLALQFWASVRELILAPITSPQARVVIVVLVIPFFVNALIFWVTDNFLMVNVRKITRGDGSMRESNSSSGMSRVYSKVHYKRPNTLHEDESDVLLSSSSNDDELLGRNENLQERYPADEWPGPSTQNNETRRNDCLEQVHLTPECIISALMSHVSAGGAMSKAKTELDIFGILCIILVTLGKNVQHLPKYMFLVPTFRTTEDTHIFNKTKHWYVNFAEHFCSSPSIKKGNVLRC